MQETISAQWNTEKKQFTDLEDALLWFKKMNRENRGQCVASWYRIGNGKVVMA
jgi:hypothetical protein